LRESLLVWCVDRSQMTFARLPYDSDDLTAQVESARRELLDHSVGQASARFAAALETSFEAQLSGARQLIVVPDGPLGTLPFAALPWGGRGESTVDRFSVTLAPSLSVFYEASRRLSVLARRPPETAVFVGDPVIDRAVYPSLSRLPSARREVAQSAQFYPRPRSFVGAEATGAVLGAALGSADVVHFAGHAIADPEFPLQATLVVAPEGDRPGFVHPSEFERALRRARTRLVVLSACSTASATAPFGEGALSLARPFLAAGVPAVLGTLADVDDGDAAALVPRFHRWLRTGLDPAEALRRAQLELKTGPDPRLRQPRAWSSFVLVGGINFSPSTALTARDLRKVTHHE
jgi:CHAT domain-containing protein